MSVLKNSINTYQTNTDYVNDLSKDFPNISYIQGTDELKWYKYDPEHIVAVYNVTSTESATTLLNSNSYNIGYQIIDGVEQQSVQKAYTFDTLGEHIVKYKYTGASTYPVIPTACFQGCNDLTSITIPDGFEYINQNAFYNCTSLTNIRIPNSVKGFGRNAICYTNITYIKIPDGLTTIGIFSLGYNTNLTSITIPNSVTSIGNNAFKGCTSLTSFTIKATTPPTLLDANAFIDTNNCPIYVPAESVDAYKTTGNWVSLASRIQPIS